MKIATDDKGLALGGIDPLTYTASGGPGEGRADLEETWAGARWRFVSEANRDAFLAAPEQHVPQYGGHCALAMSFGQLAHANPRSFKVRDGKVYLSASPAVRVITGLIPGAIGRADRAWGRLSES